MGAYHEASVDAVVDEMIAAAVGFGGATLFRSPKPFTETEDEFDGPRGFRTTFVVEELGEEFDGVGDVDCDPPFLDGGFLFASALSPPPASES